MGDLDFIDLVQDRDRWLAAMNPQVQDRNRWLVAMNLRVP
jgi:hypothetical protein